MFLTIIAPYPKSNILLMPMIINMYFVSKFAKIKWLDVILQIIDTLSEKV